MTESSNVITYDLRQRGGTKKHFSINDIHYSVEQGNSGINVTKAIIVEKQPLYPLYTADGYDAAYNLGSAAFNAVTNYLFKDAGKATSLLGDSGSKAFSQTMKYGSVALQNTLINELSEGGSNSYFSDNSDKYANVIKNLFKTGSQSYIASYELPFLSDYFTEADGTSGWEVNGIEAMMGKFSKIAEYLNMGYPVTPNWKYESKRLQTNFEFNLINDTTDALTKNLRLIMTMLPGMMHVLIDGQKAVGTITGTKVEGEGGGFMSTVLQNNTVKDILNKLTTMFKSPNVYEVIVPGRFRWMWCAMNMSVKYAGKIFNDKVTLPYNVFNGNPELIGFPEVFKIDITIESLLPQSFNEFYYYLTKNDFNQSGYTNATGGIDADGLYRNWRTNVAGDVNRLGEEGKQAVTNAVGNDVGLGQHNANVDAIRRGQS